MTVFAVLSIRNGEFTVTIFDNGGAAGDYAHNMKEAGWISVIQREYVMSNVPVNAKWGIIDPR